MAEEATQAFQAVVGIVGICGNGLVCVAIAKVRFMHTLTNAFIFNQALIDLFGSLMTLLLSVVPIPDPIPGGVTGVLLCSIWVNDYLQWAPFNASTFNLVMLTLERYLAIVFPFRYQVLATQKVATAAILGTWISAFLLSGYGIYLRYYEAGQCMLRSVAYPQIPGSIVFLTGYLLPVIVMLVVYVHITVVLKKGASRIQPGPAATVPSTSTGTEGQGESLMRARRNTFKTLLIVSSAFIICWTPNSIIFFLFNLGVEVDFTSPIFYMSIGMVALNCWKFFILFIVMLVVYIHIIAVLKRVTERVVPGPANAGPFTGKPPDGQGEFLKRAWSNILKTLLIVSVIYAICWTPSEVNVFLFNLCVEVDFTSPVIFYLMIGMVSLNCCLNPFI
ncbi:prolactin-releasing peptide receptor-like [Acanthaster planci]|uniref:Prolactin-releasing peptide receptor-like n=1 Tax=Acanthaster planci TaxID=133434 RepID=A0A8B7Z5L9_ACAPL|nr:prolactin-releasing peptide receptor-like [Acanthaster planci]